MNIEPKKKWYGTVEIPGDKSITHRAILFNAIATGSARITNALLGEDCLSSIGCMRALGAEIEREGSTIFIRGSQSLKDAECYCGNSGTTMRLLMGLLCGQGVCARLTGDPSLSQRPMERVASPLRELGADIETTDGKAPVTILRTNLTGTKVDTRVPSAQVKSALILAALGAEGETIVSEQLKTRDHTERMLQAMGARLCVEGNSVVVRKSSLRCVDVDVPADISSAAYFMALGALLGETVCKNVGVNPTRTGILKAFDRMNIQYFLENARTVCGEPVADIRVKKSEIRAAEFTREIMPSLIDELPILAVLCAYAEGESVISGAEELKVKESNRILSTVEMLRNMGAAATATEDGFRIVGKPSLCGGDVQSYKDHRIAMSAAVGLLASERGGRIADAQCVDISFPGFYSLLKQAD